MHNSIAVLKEIPACYGKQHCSSGEHDTKPRSYVSHDITEEALKSKPYVDVVPRLFEREEILSEAGNAALDLRVSAIESKLNAELTNQITGSISFSLNNLYAGYQKTIIATGSISLPPEIPISKITSIKLVGNGQTVEESGQSSVVIQNSVSTPQTYTLTAEIAELIIYILQILLLVILKQLLINNLLMQLIKDQHLFADNLE